MHHYLIFVHFNHFSQIQHAPCISRRGVFVRVSKCRQSPGCEARVATLFDGGRCTRMYRCTSSWNVNREILKMIMTGLWTGLCNRHKHTAHRVKLKSPKRPKILKRHRKFSIQLINRAEFSPTQKLPKTTLKNKRVTNQ